MDYDRTTLINRIKRERCLIRRRSDREALPWARMSPGLEGVADGRHESVDRSAQEREGDDCEDCDERQDECVLDQALP